MEVIGEQWAWSLARFVSGGGTIIYMDHGADAARFLDASGLMPVEYAETVSSADDDGRRAVEPARRGLAGTYAWVQATGSVGLPLVTDAETIVEAAESGRRGGRPRRPHLRRRHRRPRRGVRRRQQRR